MRNVTAWMAVTADKYELPICVEDSAEELANVFGIKKCTVYTQIKKGASGKRLGYRFLRIEL
ncbi:hypothetical protein QTL86_12970 [Cellulosilyticum sp. ST5]|uniref:hypothetical protein n=1 Tax=Cellulosilyticum sp. ST5 TaxID=3055805 RepID=UPI0039775C46